MLNTMDLLAKCNFCFKDICCSSIWSKSINWKEIYFINLVSGETNNEANMVWFFWVVLYETGVQVDPCGSLPTEVILCLSTFYVKYCTRKLTGN